MAAIRMEANGGPNENGGSHRLSYRLFLQLVQQLAFAMTAPNFDNFVTILTSRVVARRQTVAGPVTAAFGIVIFLFLLNSPAQFREPARGLSFIGPLNDDKPLVRQHT